MSRFDDEVRGATAPLARERLPEGMLDESFAASPGRRGAVLLAGAVGALAVVAAVAWASGRLPFPTAADASPSASAATATCHDIDPIGAYSTEYRVFFPCADGSGLASAPRVMAAAPADEVLAAAIRDLLNGPLPQEVDAGMGIVAPTGSGDLVVTVDIQDDGLALVSFDAGLRDLQREPGFLDALEATGLQFDGVTALELQLDGSCTDFFGMLGAGCDHLAKPVEIAGDCAIVPPAFLPSGAGITRARPFPGQPRMVSWGSGSDTVIQEVGERGDPVTLPEGLDVTVRGYPGKAGPVDDEPIPQIGWSEDGCSYLVTVPGVDGYTAVDYATVYGPAVAHASPTPLPSAPMGSASVEEDGIRLTLVLDREATTFGERVWADVTVENIGSDVVHWGHSGSCDWPADVTVATSSESPAFGRTDWPGDLGVLKNVSVSDDPSVAFGFTPAEFADFVGNWGCTSDLVSDEIQPGERLSDRFAWDTLGEGGTPPPGGRYVAESTFYYFGRGDIPPELMEFNRQVTVHVALDVEGPAVDYLSPGEAMDFLLADPTLIQLLADHPRSQWTGAQLRWQDETWVLDLGLRPPGTGIVATVDAVTGEVSRVAVYIDN